jgi:5-methylcytosine-specific restriction endonuclease McrA
MARTRKKFRRSRKGRDWSARATREYILKAPHRQPTLHDQDGKCRYCGEDVVSATGKRRWHNGLNGEADCWNTYRLCTRPRIAKRVLSQERGCKCEKCGRNSTGPQERGYTWLHLDHVLAIIDGGKLTLDNFQLLCPECHQTKTAKENSARAAVRRTARDAAKKIAALALEASTNGEPCDAKAPAVAPVKARKRAARGIPASGGQTAAA